MISNFSFILNANTEILNQFLSKWSSTDNTNDVILVIDKLNIFITYRYLVEITMTLKF